MIAFTSIVAATVATMIAVGVEDDYHGKRFATREVPFDEAFLAVTDIVFAYSETLWILVSCFAFSKLTCISRTRRLFRLHVGNEKPS